MRKEFTPNHVTVNDGVARLTLTNKSGQLVAKVLIDTVDLGRVLAFGRWNPVWSEDERTYYVWNGPSRVALGRFLLDAPIGFVVDHRNHNPLDCRKENLRICTHTQNMQNRKSARRDSRSGVRNVQFDMRSGTYRVVVQANKRKITIGWFTELADAEQAAIQARKELHGEFAS